MKVKTSLKLETSSYKMSSNDCWNNFDGHAAQSFIEKYNPTFVDVLINGRKFFNKETAMAFIMPAKIGWEVAKDVESLRADEFTVFPINKREVVVYLWWD